MSGHEAPKQQFCNDLNFPREGLIVVGQEGEQFHALPSGEPIYPERYERAEYFQNGLAWVKEKGGKWKVIDRRGKEVECGNALPLNKR